MSSLLEQYCDVTQSMAFKSSEINSSSSIDSSNSNKLKLNKLKCFNCFGIQAKEVFCVHCGGTAYVTDTHPLAVLFGDVLCQKLGTLPHSRQLIWTDFDEVEAIHQQQEQLDERKIICDLCNKECDINYKYFCQCCECFFVCVKCADEKGDEINHQHPLATNKLLPRPDIALRRTDSSKINSKNNRNGTQQNQNNFDFFNITDIIDKDIKHISKDNAKVHISDDSPETEFYMRDSLDPKDFRMLDNLGPNNSMIGSIGLKNNMLGSIGPSKSLNSFGQIDMMKSRGPRQNINQSNSIPQNQTPKYNGLFNNKEIHSKQHHIQICNNSSISSTHHQQNTSLKIEKNINQNHSRLLDSVEISVRQSIDFNLYDNDFMTESAGPRQSFGYGHQSIAQEMCNGCGLQLKDFYSVCRTCQKSNNKFKVCCQCEDKKSYLHEKGHNIEMMLGNLLGRKSQMVSESAIESEQEDQQLMTLRINKKKSSLEKRPPRLPQSSFEDQLSGNKSFCKLKCTQSLKINSLQQITQKVNNFSEESRINLDCDSLYNSTELQDQLETIELVQKKSSLLEVNNSIQIMPNLSRFNSRHQEKPRVCFVQNLYKDEDYIPINFVDSDSPSSQDESPKFIDVRKIFKGQNRSSQKNIRSFKHVLFSNTEDREVSSSSREITSSVSYSRSSLKFNQRQYQRQYHSNIVEESTNEIEEFIFHQYSCDGCGCHPIKNVRYHCLECEDFDVCQRCFYQEYEDNHQHGFEKIDGLRKMQEQKAMLLQRKDLNKGKQSLLRNSNPGVHMLANTKKTVELMKRGINQLNTNVMNISKSFGNYGQILGQRMRLRQKAQ